MLKIEAINNEIPKLRLKKYWIKTPMLSINGAGLAKIIINIADMIPGILP
jgi:hypothetical protein